MLILVRRPALYCIAVFLCVGSLVGCKEKPKTLREVVAECAALPGARATTNQALKEEINRITAEGSTPLQLMKDMPEDEENIAAALAVVFDPTLVESMLKKCDQLYPAGKYSFSPIELQQVAAYRDSHLRQLHDIQKALRRPECNFAIEYDKGYFFELEFMHEVTLASRLLAFDVAVKLQEGGPTAAMPSLRQLFKLIECLADVKLLEPRVQAARLRGESLLVLAAVAQHKEITKIEHEQLAVMLQQTLNNWPPDTASLVGERAMLLHSYEAIRAHLLKWMLDKEEKKLFRKEGIYATLDETLSKTADQDELFCLRTLQSWIEAAEKPFYKRHDVYAAFYSALNETKGTPEFPFAAARLFLTDFETAARKIAVDRARCEAWLLVLATAADLPKPNYTINPVTGRSYELRKETRRVMVESNGLDGIEPIVPLPLK